MSTVTSAVDAWSTFQQRGFAVFPADDRPALEELRRQIFEPARRIFEHEGQDPARFFDEFHTQNITGTRLNELRMQLIRHCTEHVDSGSLIFKAFESSLLRLLGPDLLVQKNTNLVIQPPGDPNPTELHRDAPANSPYELVVWLPLADCYGTKSMYVLDYAQTREALVRLAGNPADWEGFEAECLRKAEQAEVPFGTALMFWTGLFHGSNVNQEKETRWSLNMRYKNLFSPSGRKDPFEFFRLFRVSPLAAMGLEFQKAEGPR